MSDSSKNQVTNSVIKGIKADTVVAKTGRSWEEWDDILDEWDVKENGSPASSRHLREEYGVGMWWSNTIVSRYRSLNGLR